MCFNLEFKCANYVVCSGFSIEGPSQAKIECDDKGDGSCDVRYWPTEPGDYAVHVVCDDEDIKDSPFMAHILPAVNDVFPEKVISNKFYKKKYQEGLYSHRLKRLFTGKSLWARPAASWCNCKQIN